MCTGVTAPTILPALQEGLLSLDELRERMPNLRRREQADNAELQAIVEQSADRAGYLRLAATLTTFLARLRSSAEALDTSERSVSCGFSSRKSSSAMTKSLSGIPSPCPPELTTLQLEARMVPHPAARVMYCVGGALGAP